MGPRIVLRRCLHGKRDQRDRPASSGNHARDAQSSPHERHAVQGARSRRSAVPVLDHGRQVSARLLSNADIGDAAKSCERAPATVRPICFQSLGRDITSYTSRDPQKTSDLCHKAAEPYRSSCYFGAVKALVDWTATTESAFAFCRIVGHEAGGPTCYQALGEEIATLLAGLPEREQQCLQAQELAAVNSCRLGAGVPVPR